MSDETAVERVELQQLLRGFFDKRWDRDQLRAALDGKDLDLAGLWGSFAVELGLAGALIPVDLGGAGGSLVDAILVLEEIGRSLVPLPFLTTSLVATSVLLDADNQADTLSAIAAGSVQVTLTTIWDDRSTPLQVRVDGDAVRLDGVTTALDGASADLLLVPAEVAGDTVVLAIEATSPGVTIDGGVGLDASLPLASVRFDDATARVIMDSAQFSIERARGLARVGLASMQVGTARAGLAETITHTSQRTQFGRRIASYQAIKHRVADMMVQVETSASAVSRALDAATTHAPEASALADLALTWACEAARRVAQETIQLHGGMGYTWEHDAHLLYRRAFAAGALLGSGDPALERAWTAIDSGCAASTVEVAVDDVDAGNDDVVTTVQEFIEKDWDPTISVRQWWERMAAEGLSIPSLPTDLGGRGWSASDEGRAIATVASAGITLGPGGLGRALAAPIIAAAGTEEQKRRFLPGIVDGTQAWCQLFSEPDAGSDLAGLRTKAVRDGDGWRITGAKTWTSNGHVADWAILLARTDSNVAKHAGITYFLFPMRQEGVDIRPIREMNGHCMFNDVFIDGAFVADDCRLGELGDGWRLANLTLSFERDSIAGNPVMTPAMPGELAGHLDRPANEFCEAYDPHSASVVTADVVRQIAMLASECGADNPATRRALAQLWLMSEIRVESQRRVKLGIDVTGAEPNIGKIHSNNALRCARDLIATILGADIAMRPSTDRDWALEFLLYAPAPSIFGGTDEIQRNIITERVLGMPREADPSRSAPFRDLTSA